MIDLVKTKTRPWRHIYHDIRIPRPKNHDIEIQGLKHHDIEKWRQISHSIVIPRHFFRGKKGMTLWFQDRKPTTLSFCGILTLMTSYQGAYGWEFCRNLMLWPFGLEILMSWFFSLGISMSQLFVTFWSSNLNVVAFWSWNPDAVVNLIL